MRILISEEQSELIVNKSKFIGYSVIANSREGFLARLREIKINNPSAGHAVYGSPSSLKCGSIVFFLISKP